MADLISTLADSILALINSKAASPTKEEVDAVLRLPIETAIDAERMASYPVARKGAWIKAIAAAQIKAGDPVVFQVRCIAEINANRISERQLKADCQGEAASPLPCRIYGRRGHEFTQWGKDKNGLLCMPNDQWDVTGGTVRRCQCGIEKTD